MKLTEEELNRLRFITARERAITVRPEVFSKEELFAHFIEQMSFMSEIIRDRKIESSEAVEFDVYTGSIHSL